LQAPLFEGFSFIRMYLILIIVLGLVFGSFITEFSYRFPKQIPFAKGRSFCDKCRTSLSWKDNIPLLSYLMLQGRCRYCRKNISIRYPLIEVATALGFFVTYTVFVRCNPAIDFFGLQMGNICWLKSNLGIWAFPLALFIYLAVVAVSVIDLEEQIIPDELIYIPYLIIVILLIYIHPDNFYTFILSGFAASVFLLILHLITRGRGMGLGDVKFVLLGGTLLGISLMLLWLTISFVLGAVTGLFLIAIKKAEFGKNISFGPFLAAALIITFLFGTDILKLLGFI